MGLFDRFKKKNDSVLPSEVDEYYKSELKTRRGSSVLMAILALIVTLAIAAGLFFGGRAIYRTLSNDDRSKESADQNNQDKQGVSQPPAQTGSDDNNSNSSSSVDQPTQSNPAPSNTTPSSGDNIPSTGDDAPSLPRTGDEGL